MRNIHFIKFSFGTNIHRRIPSEQIEYFSSFFSTYFNTEYTVNQSLSEEYKTIPISYRKISSNSNILAKKLVECLTKQYEILDLEKKFKANEDLVVIDIKSNFRDTTLLYLANEIEVILKVDIGNIFPRFVLILEDIPATIGKFASISEYIKAGKILLIDKKKRFQFKSEDIQVNKDFSFDSFTTSALDRTKFKLIRKIGHYGRYKDEEKNDLIACNQFFYDGRDCVDDISDVLFNRIITLKDKDSFDVTMIIFDCPESPWLIEAILLLDSNLKSLKHNYDLSYEDYKNISAVNEKSDKEEKILFVVDLIHTGDVFKSRYKLLKEKYPSSQIKSLAILVSDTGNKFLNISGNIAEIEYSDDEKISVEFFLNINQKRYEVYGKCPMCNELHIEIIKDSSYINEDVLTSFETWTMCDEAGYIEEDFSTERQQPFPKVIPLKPNSLNLIKENSAYLALKYTKHIERNELLDSPDLILVFPDETTNNNEIGKRATPIHLEETPSGYFAETLMQLKEIEYFGIPRNIIDKVKLEENKLPDLTFIQNDHKEFYAKLRLLSDDIIIMDEFGFSGGTLKKIIAILSIVKKKPKAYFPIFNFNPSNLNSEKKRDYKVLSLYEMDIKSS
jgi:hypothetical protein